MATVLDIETKQTYEVIDRNEGENLQLCPRCSQDRKKKKTKCFSYNSEKGIGHCSHCDLSVVKKTEFQPMQKQYKIPQWTNTTTLPDKVVGWFKERGISQQTLIDAKIGFGDEYMPQVEQVSRCIKFPYFRDGQIVNIKFRDGQKNFKLVSGAELIFFNLDSIIGQDEVIVTEGEIDALSYMEVGFKAVVSVPNGAAKGNLKLEYLDNCIDLFDHVKKIYLATDDDTAGHSLQDELSRRFGRERCYKVSFFGKKDANELLQENPLSLAETLQNCEEYAIEGVYTAKDIESEIWDLYENGLKQGAVTGMKDFDSLLSFEGGYFTMVTGIPSHGKTEFLDQILTLLCVKHGWKTAYYSPESLPLKLHHSRIASKLAGKRFNKSVMTREEVKASIDIFSDYFYFISPEKDFTLESILESARQLVKRKGIKCFVIDAWNKLDSQYTGSETQHISKSLDQLAMFCLTYDVHAFVVAHPTKMKKDESGVYVVPTLYDISGSAHFYNKTHNGITIYKRKIEQDTYLTEIHVQKVKFKHWGKEGVVSMRFDYDRGGRFIGETDDHRNYLLPIEKDPSTTYTQSSIPIPPVESHSTLYTPKPNTNFLSNKYPDDDGNDEYSAGGDPAPF